MENKDVLEFVTYCISKLGQFLNMSQRDVYIRLKESGILDGYIIPSYDVLHTFGSRYLMEDITEYMREKGVLWLRIKYQTFIVGVTNTLRPLWWMSSKRKIIIKRHLYVVDRIDNSLCLCHDYVSHRKKNISFSHKEVVIMDYYGGNRNFINLSFYNTL